VSTIETAVRLAGKFVFETVGSGAKVKRSERSSRVAWRMTVSQKDSRSAMNVGVPNGKRDPTARQQSGDRGGLEIG
jgi:hypothetical protein